MPRFTFETEELSLDNIQFMPDQFRSVNHDGFLNNPVVLIDLPKNLTNDNVQEELSYTP
jgi:hypothetical protein